MEAKIQEVRTDESPEKSEEPAPRKVNHSYRAAPSGLVNVQETLKKACTLSMICPFCGRKQDFSVPVNLEYLICECGSTMDTMVWPGATTDAQSGMPVFGNGSAPVNHRLMQRLIATCYRRPEFALKVIEHYRRDRDHAKVQEWGIDKPLLLVHAANAVVQRGHGSYWPHIILALAILLFWLVPYPYNYLLSIIGLVVSLVLGSANTRNIQHWKTYCRPSAYDPSNISHQNRDSVERILEFCDGTQPRNLFFFPGFEPFDLLGQYDRNWSLLVDRRKRPGGEIKNDPAALDLNETYENIIRRLLTSATYTGHANVREIGGENGLPAARFRIDDIAITSGRDISAQDNRFVDGTGTPQTELDADTIRQLTESADSRYRVYKRISYYDPRRDIGLVSFLRLAHQGPFTYIESAGTRLLPVLDRLMNTYSAEPTADELMAEDTGPDWWREIPYEKRRRILFVITGLLLFFAVAFVLHLIGLYIDGGSTANYNSSYLDPEGNSSTYGDSGALTANRMAFNPLMLIPWILPLIQIVTAYGGPPKLDDDWEPKFPKPIEYLTTLGLVAILPYGPERERQHRRNRVRFAKETREWDFAPKLHSLRVWQSRTHTNTSFEQNDLLLLRLANDVTIQEAFLQCLEEAGIDTTEFREGAALINNYGIIQHGKVEGNVTIDTQKNPKKKKGADSQSQKSQGKSLLNGVSQKS